MATSAPKSNVLQAGLDSLLHMCWKVCLLMGNMISVHLDSFSGSNSIYRHKVVTTVRSHDKGKKILDAHPDVAKDVLSFVIVEDIAQPGAFDKAVISEPPFEAVIHTASPFFIGHTDPVKQLLDPAIKGTVGILEAIKASAPSVKRVVVTSSFAAVVNPDDHPKVYDGSSWNPVTEEQTVLPAYTYRASKTFAERAA